MAHPLLYFRLLFVGRGGVYCRCKNPLFTPMGRWLALARGPLLFAAMGYNTKQGTNEETMYLDPTSFRRVILGND